jgi:PhnB protein
MTKSAQPIPPGYGTLTPHIVSKDAAKAIEFYKKAFGAEELSRMPGPEGKLMHASLKIGNSMLMLCDEFPGFCDTMASAQTIGKAHAVLHLYVEDTDKAFQRAIDAGATAEMPPQDMFWGDRYGKIVDPFGQPWSIATHKEDLSPDEMKERMQTGCEPAKAAAKA